MNPHPIVDRICAMVACLELFACWAIAALCIATAGKMLITRCKGEHDDK
jgi:hypothetical protein